MALCACEVAPPAREEVDYRPEKAGTVGHALCLLGFTAVPLSRTSGTGHHLVQARLNGRAALFVLDTGANVSVVDDDHAAAFGLTGAAVRGRGEIVGGGPQARQVGIDRLELGGIPIRQRSMVVTDLGRLSVAMQSLAGRAVHGLIGQDVLNEHRAVIDMDRPLLFLMADDRDPAPVPAGRCTAGPGETVNVSGNS
jgi:Aspartyl protease